jgi:antitoxin component of MazEF toxin-antitoxin module
MKFKTKVWRTGDSWVITIPSFIIKNSEINFDDEIEIEIKEG